MKDKATFAGTMDWPVFISCDVTVGLRWISTLFQRSTGTAGSSEAGDFAAAPTPAAPGGSGCWASFSSCCSCWDSCLGSSPWVRPPRVTCGDLMGRYKTEEDIKNRNHEIFPAAAAWEWPGLQQ